MASEDSDEADLQNREDQHGQKNQDDHRENDDAEAEIHKGHSWIC